MTSVRAATAGDARVIASLLTQLGYPTPEDVIPARIAEMVAAESVVFVAVDDDAHVIGLATGVRHASLHAGGPVAYITGLVTDAESRGRGVGRALVTALEEWAVSQGCTRLSVTSAERRADAHAFYIKCGFPLTGRRFVKVLTPPTP